MDKRRVTFIGGREGDWDVVSAMTIKGEPLATSPRLARIEGAAFTRTNGATWFLDGVRSNERYTDSAEKQKLARIQPPLDRDDATLGALIPIKKSDAWWGLAQDERRHMFEERSRHIAIGMMFLPAIARRLYHCRDLGGDFDFLTWFEYAPHHAARFDELLTQLRSIPEWAFVDREVEIRVRRVANR
ncbi:MAG: chlorite dismutase family protein [Myxococcota bacterium]|nr:chlorite dismutase family protein [Deltaproteobacteria bacterium]MDQ3336681.1 chlorite dismutase family protein [Myxococcota bacterium]